MGVRVINRVGTVLAMAAGAFVGASDIDLADAAPLSCAEQSVGDSFNSRDSRQDLDADGNSDLVVGVPNGGTTGAGAVDIHYAADGVSGYRIDSPRAGTTQRIGNGFFVGLPGFPHRARFGTSVAVGDFNDDFCEDLAIGVPYAHDGRGAVVIGFGSPTGISPNGAIMITGRTRRELFGSAVVARNRDVWIGAPNRNSGRALGAGAVYHYRLSGNLAHLSETISEATSGVPGEPETGDNFGQVLAAGERFRATAHGSGNEPVLVVGEPDENVHGVPDAGSVTVIDSLDESGRMQFARTITAASPGIAGRPEPHGNFGAAVSESGEFLAIGTPKHDIGTARNAGRVTVVSLKGSMVQQVRALSQNSRGMPGTAQSGDHFGASVLFFGCAAGFAGGDKECLAMGVPGETAGVLHQSGVVEFAVLHLGGPVRLTGDLAILHRGSGSGGVGGAPEAGAQFGVGLSALSYPSGVRDGGDSTFHGGASLVVAVPGADASGVRNSGAVIITDGVARGRRVHSAMVEESVGATVDERYGVGARTTDNGPAVYITPE